MNKRLVLLLLSVLLPYALSAQGVQFDKRAVEQATKNGLAAKGAEDLIHKSFEKAKKAQEVINKYTTIVQLNLEAIQKQEQDVSAFRAGTKAAKELSSLLSRTLSEIKLLSEDVAKYPYGTLAYHKSFSMLYKETIGIGTRFLTIVTDGKERLGSIPSVQTAKNLLSPIKRLEILNKCIYDLERVWTMARHIRIGIQSRNSAQEVALGISTSTALNAEMLSQIKYDAIILWQITQLGN